MSSKRAQRRHDCREKRKHPTQEAAEKAMLNRAINRRSRVSAYQCPNCGAWHWGHTPGSMMRSFDIVHTGRRP